MDTIEAFAIAGLVISATGAAALLTAAAIGLGADIATAAHIRARAGLRPAISYMRRGGLHFLRAGRLGFIFYRARAGRAGQPCH